MNISDSSAAGVGVGEGERGNCSGCNSAEQSENQSQLQQQQTPHQLEVAQFIAQLIADGKKNLSKKKIRDIMALSESGFQCYKLNTIISECCKALDLQKAYSAYQEFRLKGIFPSSVGFITLINLTAGLGEIGSGCSIVREQPPPYDLRACMAVFADMKIRRTEYENNFGSNISNDNSSSSSSSSSNDISSAAAIALTAKTEDQHIATATNTSQVTTIGESVYSAVIRCCCSSGELDKALELYEELKDTGIDVKLRTFISLLTFLSTHIEDNSIDKESISHAELLKIPLSDRVFAECLRLFVDMTDRFKLCPTEREYICILRACVRANKAVEFTSYFELFLEDIFVPARDAWDIMIAWFSGSRASHSAGEYRIISEVAADKDGYIEACDRQLLSIDLSEENTTLLMSQIEGLATAENPSVSERSQVVEPSDGTETARQPTIETEKGAVGHQTEQAAVIANAPPSDGTSEDRKRKFDTIGTICSEQIVTSASLPPPTAVPSANATSSASSSKRPKGKHRHLDTATRMKKFEHYKGWLNECLTLSEGNSEEDNKPLQPIVAAAEDSKPNEKATKKIKPFEFDIIIDGANVGYYKQNFAGAPSHVDYMQIHWVISWLQDNGYTPLLILHCRHLFPDVLPAQYVPVVQQWKQMGILYETPGGCNDDWYWMYAAVYAGCCIVTNDEMRDHHFQMLGPRLFTRWRERHQVRFTFGAWEPYPSDDALATAVDAAHKTWRLPLLDFPSPYSRRMQAVPHSVEVDMNKTEFFFPNSEDNHWLCILRS